MICHVNKLFLSHHLLPHKTLKIQSFHTQNPNPKNPPLSRISRSEAQHSLFDYLHCTRGFHYLDADHISKNSPNFIHCLLSKIVEQEDDDDVAVTRALPRFLRYNPINEFEPFLESLGLNPIEVTNLMPRRLMFLNDDQIMLDNFHTLCDYGIPRIKIGKIYKEANEVFDYGYGILGEKIGAYEELGLSKSTVIKLIGCCPSLLVGDLNEDLVRVLENLRKLGFENDWIGGYLSDKSTYSWNMVLDTMGFLVKLGYSDTEMRVLFETNPTLLFEEWGKKLYILVGSLLKSGLKMNEIYSLFLRDPQVLSARCVKNLCQAICFLFEIGLESEDVASIVSNNMNLLGSHSLKRPRSVLRDLKVDKSALCRILKEDPSNLLNLASKSGIDRLFLKSHDNFLDKTTFLLRLGFVENSDEMTKALMQFRGRGDQLQERFDSLVQSGLDPNDVTSMVNRAPSMLNQSKEVLEKKIDCLRNYLNYPLDSVVAFPSYLCYDMSRINVRFSMYVWLRERGVVKPMLTLSTILACSDTRFVKYFVDKDPEGPVKWEMLRKSSDT